MRIWVEFIWPRESVGLLDLVNSVTNIRVPDDKWNFLTRQWAEKATSVHPQEHVSIAVTSLGPCAVTLGPTQEKELVSYCQYIVIPST